MAFVGMAPFGSLFAGALARVVGAQNTVIVSGIACISGGIWFFTRLPRIRKEIRPIYERLGIIPIRQPALVEEAAEN